MGEGFLEKLRDAKSGKARKEVLAEVNRLAKEKRECERKNSGLEGQLGEANRLLEEKDAEIRDLSSRLGSKEKILFEKDELIEGLKSRLEEQKEKLDENRSTVRAVRKDNAKLQKAFRTMKKIAFLPKPAEDED